MVIDYYILLIPTLYHISLSFGTIPLLILLIVLILFDYLKRLACSHFSVFLQMLVAQVSCIIFCFLEIGLIDFFSHGWQPTRVEFRIIELDLFCSKSILSEEKLSFALGIKVIELCCYIIIAFQGPRFWIEEIRVRV